MPAGPSDVRHGVSPSARASAAAAAPSPGARQNSTGVRPCVRHSVRTQAATSGSLSSSPGHGRTATPRYGPGSRPGRGGRPNAGSADSVTGTVTPMVRRSRRLSRSRTVTAAAQRFTTAAVSRRESGLVSGPTPQPYSITAQPRARARRIAAR